MPIIFGNTLPSVGIILISIGIINRDGVITLFGVVIGLIGIILASLVAIVGFEAISLLIKKLF
ncbi:MAG: hypothetical protein EOP34_12170 [Rickettsiales bacterium]|nr:MAG: hypothetical protein EOP34_12170 [Rickettsiales bacterium]